MWTEAEIIWRNLMRNEFIVKLSALLKTVTGVFSQETKLFLRVFFNEIIQRYHWGPVPLPRLPVQRQLWVRGGGLVWWLSRICCTSCSAEKPVLLFPLLQVHLMPWTAGREETQTSARQPHRPAPRQHPLLTLQGRDGLTAPALSLITGPIPRTFYYRSVPRWSIWDVILITTDRILSHL